MKNIDKLVRNGIPAEIKKEGRRVEFTHYDSFDYVEAILSKILEETQEVMEADNIDEVASEVGDLLDIIDAFIDELNIRSDVESKRQEKMKRYGDFSKAVRLMRAEQV